ncbi:MAG: hypothetical protein KF782_02690 [Labilithrix sp.]|nr:hypothetical protein [Labilithrix sp.]
MTTPDEDRDLRARFAELARRDRGRAPDFQEMWAARRAARSPWRVLVPAASLAAAALFVVWCGPTSFFGIVEARGRVARRRVSASAGDGGRPPAAETAPGAAPAGFDPAPLDFLLDVPGSAPRALGAAALDSNPLKGW